MAKLTKGEILRVVNYIGVDHGYLGDFSYRTHAEFYPMYCELDIDPNQYQGTTRERFIDILNSQSAPNQAKILRGVLEKFPSRSKWDKIQLYIQRLEATATAKDLPLLHTSEVVKQAIADAEVLISSNGASNAVDRIHTALHGYLKNLCDKECITYGKDANLTKVFKILRKDHAAFQVDVLRKHDIEKMLMGLATVIDSLNTIRNQASLSHPQDALLAEAEAKLAINASISIFHYLEDKLVVYADD